MPKLYLLCGIPGSGKTTWAKTRLAGAAHVSRDKIRFKYINENIEYFVAEKRVFNEFTQEIMTNLNNSKDTIADATHISVGSRNKLLSHLNLNKVEVIPINFIVSESICIENNNKRNGLEYVPETVIHNMFSSFAPAKLEERKEFNYIINIYVHKDDEDNYHYDMEMIHK